MSLINLQQINDSVVGFLSEPRVLNVIGGILSGFAVLVLVWLWAICRRKYSRWKFKQVFGTNIGDTRCTLAYGALELADKSSIHPDCDPGALSIEPRPPGKIRQAVTTTHEIRTAGYVGGGFHLGHEECRIATLESSHHLSQDAPHVLAGFRPWGAAATSHGNGQSPSALPPHRGAHGGWDEGRSLGKLEADMTHLKKEQRNSLCSFGR